MHGPFVRLLFATLARLRVRLLDRGRFHVAALRRGRKYPRAIVASLAHIEHGSHALGNRDMASGVVRLAVLNLNLAIANAGSLKPEALFRAQGAINQDGGNVVKQRCSVRKIDGLFGIGQHSFSMSFA